MAALTGILPARISFYEAYTLCLKHCLSNPSLAERRLIECLADDVPSWAMEPFGPVELRVWQQMLKPFAGKINAESNEIFLYGPGPWRGIEVDHAALRVRLGLTESPQPPESTSATEGVLTITQADSSGTSVTVDGTLALEADSNITTARKRKSCWSDDVDRVLKELFPGDDAKSFPARVVVKRVRDALADEIKQSGRPPPSRGLICRKTGHWRS